jgi:hypothetical protein
VGYCRDVAEVPADVLARYSRFPERASAHGPAADCLGADTGIRDARFDGTPLGWARYFGEDAIADLLEPLTA